MPLKETDTPQLIVLVTPVWNDSKRLAVFGRALASALTAAELPIRWIIADDGSDADEARRYNSLREQFAKTYPEIELLRFGTRSRKGGAVYDAWNQVDSADYYAFVDADGAVSPETILHLIKQALEGGTVTHALIGIRPLSGHMEVHRSWLRKCVFCAFRILVRGLVGARFEDTQCGAKVVSGTAYRAVAGKLKERGFIFDVELLVALQRAGVEIREEPIAWCEVAGSRLRLSSDSFEMIRGLLRIRRRLRAGHFSKKNSVEK
ncbi:MAG: glycosyltransferase [Verrucomicrobia bacterium]|jgi:glycosyltransferase involved in cell wall biosynthesis|nr:glycosyltransferase [Verrucomicrobiota bacterium]